MLVLSNPICISRGNPVSPFTILVSYPPIVEVIDIPGANGEGFGLNDRVNFNLDLRVCSVSKVEDAHKADLIDESKDASSHVREGDYLEEDFASIHYDLEYDLRTSTNK
jgi:hypothetical protein